MVAKKVAKGTSRAGSKAKTRKAAPAKKSVKSKKKPAAKLKAAPKKKAPAKKPQTKKPPTKKPAPKKAAAKKSTVKKPIAKKAPAKKPAAKKPVAKKAAAKPKSAAPSPKVQKKAEAAAPAVKAKAKAKAKAAPTKSTVKVAPAKPVAQMARGKILSRQFLFDVAAAIKAAVEPLVKQAKGGEVVGQSVSGDATFEIDRVAERTLLQHLKNERAPVAYYSEDAGYSTFSNVQPRHLLIVDPIDGTRAAKNGFEGCVVSIASTRIIERPRIRDLDNACVMEIVGDRTFYAERGKGTKVFQDDHFKKPRLSENTDLESVTWSMTVPARPAELIFPTAARLIDLTSLKGGFFACNSTSYSLTRLLTGQQDACVDFAVRYLKDIPELVRDHFINAGRGCVLGVAPYDLAAACLIAEEAGCTVTNAYGKKFDDVLLLDSTEANFQSLIAASNPVLHKKLLSFFDTRIKQFEALLKRRAGV